MENKVLWVFFIPSYEYDYVNHIFKTHFVQYSYGNIDLVINFKLIPTIDRQISKATNSIKSGTKHLVCTSIIRLILKIHDPIKYFLGRLHFLKSVSLMQPSYLFYYNRN